MARSFELCLARACDPVVRRCWEEVSAGFQRGEDDQRRAAQVLDRVPDAIVGRQPADLDGRDLDHGRAQVDELAAKWIDLVARACDQDPPAVEWTL